MTLSVTERNNLGNIRVRHADDETQVFEVESIIEDGIPKSFEGLTPFFCLMAREITGQGVSEEPVKVFDAKKGTLKYTLSPNAFQMIGRNEAYFSFRKELSNGRWTEQFSTRTFHYTVEKSIYSEPFKDSNYWWTFKELYIKLNEYIASGKISWEDFMNTESDAWKAFMESETDSWKNFINQNKEVIESIDPGGILLSEVISSRDGEKSLKERLERDKNAHFIRKIGGIQQTRTLIDDNFKRNHHVIKTGNVVINEDIYPLVIAEIDSKAQNRFNFQKVGDI
ncbi:phage baseplate upper protein [Listeria monocytogenes]|nr:phage baseplate upper protein [Listeria monocytogenes]